MFSVAAVHQVVAHTADNLQLARHTGQDGPPRVEEGDQLFFDYMDLYYP
jgi:hypothetical protein